MDEKQLTHHTITLTMDDDSEVECSILTVFSVKDNDYIALLPLDESGQNEDGEVYLYRFSTSENGDPILSNIEDDEEYESAGKIFDELVERAIAEENEHL